MNILDILFPPVCVGCRSFGSILCRECIRQLIPTVVDICPYCYLASPWGRTHTRCQKANCLDGAISLFRYNAIAKQIIKNMKYRYVWNGIIEVSRSTPQHWWRIEAYVNSLQNLPYFQAVPLHKEKLKSRGFNQSDILIRIFQEYVKIQQIQVLHRRINTAPQAQQPSRAARIINIKDAFECSDSPSILGKTILLVDDLFTSGSTAKECAKVLKKSGAALVFLITFAHGR